MFCWFFRFVISSAADSGSPFGRWTSRHVTRCASCGQFLQSCHTIGTRLRSEAAGWQPSYRGVPSFTGVRLPSHNSPIRVALATAACLTISAALLLFHSIPARPPHVSSPTTTAIIPTGAQWTTKWVELIPNPLAAEAENLTSDTESGIRFLVACLDVRPLAASTAPRPGQPVLPSQ